MRTIILALVLLISACTGGVDEQADLRGTPDSSDMTVPPDLGDTMAPPDLRDTLAPPDLEDTIMPPDLADTVGSPDTSDAADTTAADSPCGDCDVPPDPPEEWRSILYPTDWTPEYTTPEGYFVHDFSYAGYHNSEIGIPTLEGPVFNVVEYGADPAATGDSNDAIQAAIDAAVAAGGGVVFFPAGLYRCDDRLTIHASNIVLRGEGPAISRIYFSRHLDMSGKAHIYFYGSAATSMELPLAADGVPRESTVLVEDATGLAPGDDVGIGWVISDAFIEAHGMTGTWGPFNGTWQTFFQREIVAIDTEATPNVVTLDVPLRYPALVSNGASLQVRTGYINEVGVEDLGLANAVGWDEAWANDRTSVLTFVYAKDAWVRNVASFQSPLAPTEGNGADSHLQNCGVQIRACKRVTVADSSMEVPQDRGGGGSGYLFEVLVSSEILFRDCYARAGRHNFIQNSGFGTTGCVWLRCFSEDGLKVDLKDFPMFGSIGYSEFHHSLATANLVDSSTFHDGWKAVNRQQWSSGAGHSSTEDVLWNTDGDGKVYSRQWGVGYVIGTSGGLETITTLDDGPFNDEAEGTEPEDFTEGLGDGATLLPASLFEDQLARRLEQE